jgi:hypothetical protein
MIFHPLLIYGAGREMAERSAAAMTAETAQREARSAKTAVELLQQDVERLLMITEALWLLLKNERGYQDADLERIIADIDLRDGPLDGRVAPSQPRGCPYCGHTVGKKRPYCYYCGKPVGTVPFER